MSIGGHASGERTWYRRVFGFESVRDRDWLYRLLGLGMLSQVLVFAPLLIKSGRPVLGDDAVLFQYSGWWMTQGGVAYIDIWDPKPPLVHEVATVLAYLSNGNMTVLYALSACLMATLFVTIVALTWIHVYDLTGDGGAAFAAGLFLLTPPFFYGLPAAGLYPKMLAICLGLAAVYLLRRERTLLAGVSAALAASAWQMAVVFALVVLGTILGNRRWDHVDIGTCLLGMIAASVLVLAPFVAQGALDVVITQTVIAPFVADESTSLFFRIYKGGRALKLVALLLPVGALAIAYESLIERRPDRVWLLAGVSWSAFQLLVVDFDAQPDTMLVLVFTAMGYGLLVTRMPVRIRTAAVGVLAAVAMLMFVWEGSDHLATTTTAPLETGSLEWRYWTETPPEGCHVRGSAMEQTFMESSDTTKTDAECRASPLITRLFH